MRHRLSPAFFRLFATAVAALLALGLMTAPTASAADPASISGTVRAAVDNSPLAGATVKAYLTPNVTTPAATATTAGDGTYTFTGLGAGTYKIQFTANNASYQTQWYWFAQTATDAQPLTLASGDSTPFIDGYLADATTSLSGTVSDSNSAPIQGVTVGMYSTGDTAHPIYTVPTAVDGTYAFTGIAPGSYLLRFTGDSDLFADDWYWLSPDPADATPITVSPGDHLAGYDQNLSDVTTSLSGTVYGSDGVTPILGATVGLYASGNTTVPVATATSAADGSYRFAGMTPGQYKLYFSADPSRYQPQWYWNSADPDDATDIDIEAGTHDTGWSVILSDATTSLDGFVFAPDGVTPVAGATVGLYRASDTDTPVANATTAADGAYHFAGMATDTYKLYVSPNTSLYQPQWYWNTANPEDASTIDIAPGSHDSGWNFQLSDGTMSIGGNVYDQGLSAPLKGATVSLFASSNTGTALATTTSVGDGSFLFSGLIAGNYLVEFTDPPLFAAQWYSFATDPGSALELVLSPGQHQTAYGYLTPSADWTSYGTVTITGTPAVGAMLTAAPSGWSPDPTGAYQYAWFIDGTQVPVATGSTFTVTPAAAQHNVTVAVTAVSTGLPAASATASVSIPASSFTPGSPTISGATKVGATLTASPGSWSPTPDRFTYQWNVGNGLSMASTTSTAVIPDWALGYTITAAVTAHRYGYPDSTRSSAQIADVTAGSLTTGTPLIAGTPVVGVTLSATPGTWGPAPGITYQWKSSGTAISGATGSTFTPTATQLGHPLTVTVTGTQSGYTTASTTSLATSNVGLGTLSATTPTITGSPVVGGTLTAVPGKWRPYSVVMSYQWYVDGVAFPGATAQTFVIPGSAAGQTITVAATGSETGYTSTTLTSSATAAVTGGALSGPTPTITGNPQVGATLTANPGTWAPAPVTLGYQWAAGGTNITGATSSTLIVPAGALGKTITVTVTASKSGFATQAKTSVATAAVIAGVLTTATPTISGSPSVGSSLTAVPGSWGPGSVSFTYQWKANGAAISGATAATFTISAAQLGSTVTVAVTGTETGYATATSESAATATITGSTFTTIGTPTITGTPVVGGTLTAGTGTWAPTPDSYSYQWKANGAAISGATASTYVVAAALVGQTVTVTVTAHKSGYADASATSAATAAVAAGALTAPTPTISGTAVVGGTLNAVPGVWGPGAVALTYQWKANGTAITGATASTFTITPAQLGQTVTVAVTGTETGYTTATKESAATAAVVAGALTAPTPTISGVAAVGSTLTAVPGVWGPGAVALTYQWKANGAAISGATAATFTISAAQLGSTVTVAVTGTETGYATATSESAATATITGSTFTTIGTPTITGTPVVGGTLTAGTGTWAPTPDSYSYQWKANGAAISGATASTYVVAAALVGQTVTVTVTAHKSGYADASATSAATAAVAAGTLTAPTPTITGSPFVGATLTAHAGSWGPGSVTLTYQWKANGSNISGATSTTYVPAAGDFGKTITVAVTGTEPGYTAATVDSAATASIAAAAFNTIGVPTISGTPVVGGTLSAGTGTWAPTPDSYSYQWKANGTAISGATGSTFTLTGAQLGVTVTVTVTAHKAGYADASASSAPTAAVAAGTLTAPTPTITGTAVVGGTLTAVPGVWGPGTVALTYQWKAGGTNITGATAATFTITAAQLGQAVTVAVTGTETGYTSATKESVATAAVSAAEFSTVGTPTITGTPVVGGTLTAGTGTWAPTPDSYSYQWKANGAAISSATASTYVVAAALVGQAITVTLTAHKSGYADASATSAATAAVAAGALTAPTPTITGTAVVGGTLAAVPGVWGPGTVALTYQWKANGTAISGATASTFTITAAQLGQTITVAVTGTETGYTAATKVSAATAGVAQGATGTISGKVVDTHGNPVTNIDVCLITSIGDEFMMTPNANGEYAFTDEPVGTYTMLFLNSGGSGFCVVAIGSTPTYQGQYYQWMSNSLNATPIVVTAAQPSVVLNTVTLTAIGEEYSRAKPTITGTATVGATLTAHAGSWFPAPGSVTLQWKANGVAIAGATNSSYTLTAAEAGKAITVTETAAGPTVTTASAASAATAAVTPGTLTAPTPTITGTAKVGSALTAVPGTWAPSPVTLTYQWKANNASISGATAGTYVVAASLVGKTITVTVSGAKTGYTTTAKTSASTVAVVAGTLTAPTPTITGTAKVGSVLTAHPGTWAPSPVTLTYQWKQNGSAIAGATGASYTVAAGYVGKKITITVTGTKTGYTTIAKTSVSTATVVAGTLTAPTPTITGTVKVGSVLTAHSGTWAPSPVTLVYQWKANGTSISGATHSTYTMASGLVGKKITVTVTGTKAGYTTIAKTSASTAAVAAGTLSAQVPSISGTAKVGKTLTANPGTWAPAPVTLTYQWKANGTNISGATAKTYVISSSVKGKKITVTVTGTKSGYTTVAKTSLSTATVS